MAAMMATLARGSIIARMIRYVDSDVLTLGQKTAKVHKIIEFGGFTKLHLNHLSQQ